MVRASWMANPPGTASGRSRRAPAPPALLGEQATTRHIVEYLIHPENADDVLRRANRRLPGAHPGDRAAGSPLPFNDIEFRRPGRDHGFIVNAILRRLVLPRQLGVEVVLAQQHPLGHP